MPVRPFHQSALHATLHPVNPIHEDLLEEVISRLANELRPEGIWLFGSHAWGTADEGSDLDLFVVVPESDETPVERMRRAHRCLPASASRRMCSSRPARNSTACASCLPRSTTSFFKGAGSFMDDTTREWVRPWLVKAHSDLRSARALMALAEPATDTAIYHCQQAAEKALTGCLAFRDQPLERTHDLERLLELVSALDPAFASLETQASILSPYATAFRYPDTPNAQFPSVAEVKTAMECAQAVYDCVLASIPEAARPR